ncbi:MAG: TRAP transporter substrate-binding protein [Veillonellales bacterium]
MKKYQWISLLVLSMFAVSVMLTGCGSSSSTAQKKTIVLKAADNQIDTYPTVMGLKYMAKLLDERTQGRITMQVYSGGQLGGEKETIEMTQMGTIGVNRISTGSLAGFDSKLTALTMPFVFRDADHLWKVLNGDIGKELLNDLNKDGIIGLTYYDSGARSFYTKNKAIDTVEAAKGQKLRVLQSKIFVDFVDTLGASATPMGYAEVYSGLQTGLIDGAENNPPSLWAMKHYESCKYFALDEHMMVPEVVVISKKIWDTLSPEDQQIVRQAAVESTEYQKKAWADYTDQALKDLAERGVVISKPDKEPFRKAVSSMYEKYPEYKEIISRIQAVQ